MHSDRMSQQSRYNQALNFIQQTVETEELGYIYTFPDKRLYRPVADTNTFIKNAWKNYEGSICLYVHVPFCTPKLMPEDVKKLMEKKHIPLDGRDYLCAYCNLFTTPTHKVPSQFTQILIKEIEMYRRIFKDKKLTAASLYFGGGTPSLLTAYELKTIREALVTLVGDFPDNIEQALECSPDSVDREKLQAVHESGFNRLSIGVQTFNKQVLHYLGRNYDPMVGYEAIKIALEVGFCNVNGDLIVGLPFSTENIFFHDLDLMIELNPQTITLYQDMTRPLTRFGKMKDHGILPSVSSKEIYAWVDKANTKLKKNGYVRKTLTCWLKKDGGYQQGEDIYKQIPLLGFGPGARSYGPYAHYDTDYAVASNKVNSVIANWLLAIKNGKHPKISGFKITKDIQRRRDVILGLMSENGIINKNAAQFFQPELKALIDTKLVTIKNGTYHYTEKGKSRSGALSKLFFGEKILKSLQRYEHK